MRYSLQKVDGIGGDSGPMSQAIFTDGNEVRYENEARPRVGVVMRVGSMFSRSYAPQDWWQTSYIEEILEEREDYVKFRTKNSIYEWRIF